MIEVRVSKEVLKASTVVAMNRVEWCHRWFWVSEEGEKGKHR